MARARVALFALLAVLCSAAPAYAQVNDTDILNFALQLECLEAQFYSWAAFGHGLADNDTGSGPAPINGSKALLSYGVQKYAEEIAYDEIAHVRFLRTALGPLAVPCPLIDLAASFATAANAAVNATLKPPFSPYGSDIVFLHGAFIFEDVGVTAYKGAAPLISSKAYLGPAAGILAVEAYHAGIIRTLLSEIADQTVYPYGAPVGAIVEAISNLRDTLAGTEADQGIVDASGTGNATVYVSNLVPTDANSIAFDRTPSQVIKIVTAGSATGKGLFFPNGLNGKIAV